MTVRDLLPTIPVSGPVEYARRTAFVNAAATVAEGALQARTATCNTS